VERNRALSSVSGWRARAARGICVSLLALSVGGSLSAPAAAQESPCLVSEQPVRLMDMQAEGHISANIDLFFRTEDGGLRATRLAGLRPWGAGWPLAEELRQHVGDYLRNARLCLTVLASPGGPRNLPLGEVRFAGTQGSIAESFVRRGWAQVANDAEAVVPDMAPFLRAAEAEARAERLGLWLVEPLLTDYVTPGGFRITVDRRLIPTLDLLASMPDTRSLLETAGRRGVPIFFMDTRGAHTLAYYDPFARVAAVELGLVGADPRTIALPLAHELVHAQDHAQGMALDRLRHRWTPFDEAACFQTEYNAAEIEAVLWERFYGREGLRPVSHRVERHENLRLEDYLASPEYMRDQVARIYRYSCEPAR
jgi:hypothetical protein